LGFILGVIITEIYAIRSENFSQRLSYQAIQRTVPKIHLTPVIVRIGSVIHLVPPGDRMSISNRSPYQIEIANDGKLLLHAEIKDASGAIVAIVKDSNIFLLKGMEYDINSDNDAIEVVDEKKQPIFQITRIVNDDVKPIAQEVRDNLKVWEKMDRDSRATLPARNLLKIIEKNREVLQVFYVSYLFSDNNKQAGISIADHIGYSEGPLEKLVDRRRNLKCMFKYPGYLFPGARL